MLFESYKGVEIRRIEVRSASPTSTVVAANFHAKVDGCALKSKSLDDLRRQLDVVLDSG